LEPLLRAFVNGRPADRIDSARQRAIFHRPEAIIFTLSTNDCELLLALLGSSQPSVLAAVSSIAMLFSIIGHYIEEGAARVFPLPSILIIFWDSIHVPLVAPPLLYLLANSDSLLMPLPRFSTGLSL
jgi:hypothetical protein